MFCLTCPTFLPFSLSFLSFLFSVVTMLFLLILLVLSDPLDLFFQVCPR